MPINGIYHPSLRSIFLSVRRLAQVHKHALRRRYHAHPCSLACCYFFFALAMLVFVPYFMAYSSHSKRRCCFAFSLFFLVLSLCAVKSSGSRRTSTPSSRKWITMAQQCLSGKERGTELCELEKRLPALHVFEADDDHDDDGWCLLRNSGRGGKPLNVYYSTSSIQNQLFEEQLRIAQLKVRDFHLMKAVVTIVAEAWFMPCCFKHAEPQGGPRPRRPRGPV